MSHNREAQAGKHRINPVVRAMSIAFGAVAILGALPAAAQQTITVTGSRILKADFDSSSPIVTITAAELTAHQDVTLETFLNTLPQVNPHGTTTSNNPGNGGQANIDLRGLGSNRNLILIDGRRPMVSASDQSVDLNTIPIALIESIEIISGGAAAVYGADAVSGVVNIKLKKRFEGLNLRAGYTNSTKFNDARERNVGATFGGNFAGNRGNAALSFEYAEREGMIKSQRNFAAVATATTSFFPEGTWRVTSNNAPSQAAVDALYGQASYGSNAPGAVPSTQPHSFNTDGSLFYPGIFNSPRDVLNFRYPIDSGVNTNLFPDVYSYNFDAVNVLTLPLERRSVMGKFDFRLTNDVEVFSRFGNTRYTSFSALAPTPVSTVTVAAPGTATSSQGSSALIEPTRNIGAQLVVPVTNPFIPADLATLLASRTGDNPVLVGAGATEPFLMRWRTLGAGLRKQNFTNDVTQYMGGARGALSGSWTWEAYLSEGKTKITNKQEGNIDTNRLLGALARTDGGVGLCAGGVNPFGRQPLSAECATYLQVSNLTTTEFNQTIGQAYATGEVGKLPAGTATAVLGAEFRQFSYSFDPGSASGPISGFNVQTPAGGNNSFKDVFGELSLPLLKNHAMAKSLDVSLALRSSKSQSEDEVQGISSPSKNSNAWSLNLDWKPINDWRARASLQSSVRAPNFGELFDGGGSAPQIFDPCSVTSVERTTGANAASLRTLCRDAGQIGGLGGNVDLFVQTPGTQASIQTEGNTNLNPETGNSVTVGLVWTPSGSGFRAAVDYYSVTVKDAITVADSNEIIADCYNYTGANPTYSATRPSCAGLFRSGDILGVEDLSNASGAFAGTNGGRIKTSGIDFNLGWGGRVGPGKLDTQLNLSYLIEYKLKTAGNLPTLDFAGTIPYFGAGLGQAFPRVKASLSAQYKMGDLGMDARIRYIDKMTNRMGKIFTTERFTGVSATTYLDVGGSWDFAKGKTVRAGFNNLLDQKPKTYAPNVQSGTDPSTYDIVGRRFYMQANFQFD